MFGVCCLCFHNQQQNVESHPLQKYRKNGRKILRRERESEVLNGMVGIEQCWLCAREAIRLQSGMFAINGVIMHLKTIFIAKNIKMYSSMLRKWAIVGTGTTIFKGVSNLHASVRFTVTVGIGSGALHSHTDRYQLNVFNFISWWSLTADKNLCKMCRAHRCRYRCMNTATCSTESNICFGGNKCAVIKLEFIFDFVLNAFAIPQSLRCGRAGHTYTT